MSHTSGSIARFEVDGVAYQARLFAIPFHVPENGRVRAHAIGRPDMPFSGVHALARWLEARCLPPGVGLVMADRLFRTARCRSGRAPMARARPRS